MPRGGKRPGAGAPKGNFNGMTRGNRSERATMVYVALSSHPDHRALAHELYHAGFYPAPSYRFNRDLPGLLMYLYNRWFDCAPGMQSNAINCSQTHGGLRPDPPPTADTNQPADPPDQR